MAVVDVTYNCGCGFKTGHAEAALQHSDTKHHIMEVHGTISPTSNSPALSALQPSKSSKPKELNELDEPASKIAELRQRIGRR